MPSPSSGTSLRASGTSARSPSPPITAPSSPRVPVSASATIPHRGIPGHAQPVPQLPQPGPVRSLSGTWTEFRPSNATVRSPRQVTPRVHGDAERDRDRLSNTAFGPAPDGAAGPAAPSPTGGARPALPARRSSPRPSDTRSRGTASSPATKYIPTRDGSARIRFAPPRSSPARHRPAQTAGNRLAHPDDPGRTSPAATVTTHGTVTMAD